MPPPVVNAKRATRRKPVASGRSTRASSAPTLTEVEPTLRADAAANRKTLIETAAKVFGKEGINASVEGIAKKAGVGIGTLYRHFPTKQALLAAIIATRIDEMAEAAEALADAPDPGKAFEQVVETLVVQGAAKKDFMTALGGTVELTGPVMMAAKERFRIAVAALVGRAQAAGTLRSDIDVLDVLSLVRGCSYSSGDDERARTIHLRVLLDGLRR